MAAGYKSASAAARHFGWGEANYRHHENGTRSYGVEQAVRYAEAYAVPATWLLDLGVSGVDLWRLPMGKVYTEALLPQLTIWPGLEDLVNNANEILGLFFIPELEVKSGSVDPVRDDQGRPIFHFVSPQAVGVAEEKFEGGFLFLTKAPEGRPNWTVSEGDLCLIDSQKADIGARPDLWLLRNYDEVMTGWVRCQSDGRRVLMPDAVNESATFLDPHVSVLGRIVWVGRKLS
jgi:hypothetical protein